MIGKSSLVLLLLATIFVSINGHGRLMEPVARSSAWRLPKYSESVPKFSYDSEWCAGRNDNRNARNSTCGVCGPIYNGKVDEQFTEISKPASKLIVNTTSFERNSFAFKNFVSIAPYIVETYQKGQWIRPRVKIDANHGGDVSFRICPIVDEKVDPSMECFDQNDLFFENGATTFPLNDGKVVNLPIYDKLGAVIKKHNMFEFKVKLPNDLVCEHCLFQWKWVGQNLQKYYGCSDISIQE